MTYPENIDLETPEADAAEQAASARPEDDVDETEPSADDQDRIVALEDDYR